MSSRRCAICALLILCVPILFGCSILSAPAANTQTPIQLERCSSLPAALCLDSFGLGQDQLLITFYFPAAGSSEFFLKIWQGEVATTYPCTQTEAAPSTIYCTGPLIPLGSSVKIELYTMTGRIPLAAGEFALNGLALPTAGPATTPGNLPTPTPTVRGTTPVSGTAYPNP
jgi:hypothetical protein